MISKQAEIAVFASVYAKQWPSPAISGSLRGNKLRIQVRCSGIKHIIGRADTREYFLRNHVACFAAGTFAGIVSCKPEDTLLSGFGKLKNIRFGFE